MICAKLWHKQWTRRVIPRCSRVFPFFIFISSNSTTILELKPKRMDTLNTLHLSHYCYIFLILSESRIMTFTDVVSIKTTKPTTEWSTLIMMLNYTHFVKSSRIFCGNDPNQLETTGYDRIFYCASNGISNVLMEYIFME